MYTMTERTHLDFKFRGLKKNAQRIVFGDLDRPLSELLNVFLADYPDAFPSDVYNLFINERGIDLDKKASELNLKEKDIIEVELSTHLMEVLNKSKTLLESEQIKNVVLFLGAGISAQVLDGNFSSKQIHYNFLDTFAASEPREFNKRKNELKQLQEAIEERKGPLDMLEFMTLLVNISNLKERFMSHVIRSCCNARPAKEHDLLLTLLDSLRKKNTEIQLTIFTTNYDNLLEKASREQPRNNIIPIYCSPMGQISDDRSISLCGINRYQNFNKIRKKWNNFKNGMVVEDTNMVPIIPIHGSIRIVQCEKCDSVLETQVGCTGERFCIYCGAKIPSIILPTAEGEVQKGALSILGKSVRDCDILVFIGYSFGDPHILDSIARNLSDKAKIINITRSKEIPAEFDRTMAKFDILTDIAPVLAYYTREMNLENS